MRAGLTNSRRAFANPGGESGHDYFASMTDLMLGLVFVFIIVLMVLAFDQRQAAPVAAEIPPAPAAPSAVAEASLARVDLLRAIAQALDAALPVTVDEENGTLQLGGDILFPTGSAEPYPEALPKLRLLAAALDKVLPCYAIAADARAAACDNPHHGRLDAVFIEGHTDTTPIHTQRFQSNWDLSAARASATFAQLVASFPALAALENDQDKTLIGVSGYGDLRPIDTSGTAAGLKRNRRIELRFIMATPGSTDVANLAERVDAARTP
jgi:outer membrane protein OmpA-like peptidoglycan-associated protein